MVFSRGSVSIYRIVP